MISSSGRKIFGFSSVFSSEKNEKKDNRHAWPDEIYLLIFSFLPRKSMQQMAFVDKYWHAITVRIIITGEIGKIERIFFKLKNEKNEIEGVLPSEERKAAIETFDHSLKELSASFSTIKSLAEYKKYLPAIKKNMKTPHLLEDALELRDLYKECRENKDNPTRLYKVCEELVKRDDLGYALEIGRTLPALFKEAILYLVILALIEKEDVLMAEVIGDEIPLLPPKHERCSCLHAARKDHRLLIANAFILKGDVANFLRYVGKCKDDSECVLDVVKFYAFKLYCSFDCYNAPRLANAHYFL